MAKKISAEAWRELVEAIGERYRAASKQDRARILDEFVAVTGFHRKHSIRVLKHVVASAAPARRPRLRVYAAAVREALVVLWEASDRVCGKRLKRLLPTLVGALEHHGHLRLDEGVRKKLLQATAATIDRVLAEPRRAGDGRRLHARAKPAGLRRDQAAWRKESPFSLPCPLGRPSSDAHGTRAPLPWRPRRPPSARRARIGGTRPSIPL